MNAKSPRSERQEKSKSILGVFNLAFLAAWRSVALAAMLTIAGCTQTITRAHLAAMQADTGEIIQPSYNRPGNDLWYMGAKNGYDYYHYYDRSGSLNSESTYRVPTVGSGDEFAFTGDPKQWRRLSNATRPDRAMRADRIDPGEAGSILLIPDPQPTIRVFPSSKPYDSNDLHL
ncbi:hypothetical protein BH10PLA1_BH10PLA1_21610 [soil metagenome]